MGRNGTPLVLITGGAGYVGYPLIRECLSRGWGVRCLDMLVYGGKPLAGFINHPRFELMKGDVRNKKDVEKALEDVQSVVHLAAIVGDLPCQAAPKAAHQINFKGTQLVADMAKKKKVRRFVFASTCSNYGITGSDKPVGENWPLNPVSLYAETKIDGENYLRSIADDHFYPTSLRFGTAYGVSQRTRFDLMINSFVYEAIFKGELVVFAANLWRPYIHVVDMTTIMLNVLNTPESKIGNSVYNAGSNSQNFIKEDVVKMIAEQLPEIKVKYASEIDDKRNYCVDFTKLEREVGFQPTRSVQDGIRELIFCFRNGILTEADYESNNLDRLRDFFKEREAVLSQ